MVLEHVEFPQKVINEFYRVLKPNGKLFLTAPQGWGVHGAPHNYYNFTKYGLKSMFEKSGFEIKFINPNGGLFCDIGKRIKEIPEYILYQYIFKKDKYDNVVLKFNIQLVGLLLFPFYFLALLICKFIIPLLFYYLDKLDKSKQFTIMYSCYCVKK